MCFSYSHDGCNPRERRLENNSCEIAFCVCISASVKLLLQQGLSQQTIKHTNTLLPYLSWLWHIYRRYTGPSIDWPICPSGMAPQQMKSKQWSCDSLVAGNNGLLDVKVEPSMSREEILAQKKVGDFMFMDSPLELFTHHHRIKLWSILGVYIYDIINFVSSSGFGGVVGQTGGYGSVLTWLWGMYIYMMYAGEGVSIWFARTSGEYDESRSLWSWNATGCFA